MDRIDHSNSRQFPEIVYARSNRVFTSLVILLTLVLWIYGDYIIVDSPDPSTKPRFLGIPYSIVNMMVPIIFAYYFFNDFKQKLHSERNAIIIFLFVLYFLIGLFSGSTQEYIESDTLMLIAFFSGYSFMWLIWKSKKPEFYLSLTMLCFSFFMLFNTRLDLSSTNYSLDRYTSPILWDYSLSLYFLIGINAVWSVVNNKKIYLLFSILSLIILFYCGVLIGATRSLAISIIVLICFTTLSIYILPIQKGLFSIIKRLLLFGAIFFIGVIIYKIAIGDIFGGYTMISSRLTIDHNWFSRYKELASVLEQVNILGFLIGIGIGGIIPTSFGHVHIPHIAIFWFLISFGLIPFLYVIYLCYIKIPLSYLKNIRLIKRTGKIHPILIVAPGLFAWFITMLISGGISYFGFFTIGITLCFYENYTRFRSVKL